MLESTEKTTSKNNNSQILKASEIGQYNFCSISWKLQRNGFIPKKKDIDKGTEAHIYHGKKIEKIEKFSITSKIMILAAMILLFLALLIITIGVIH